MTPVRQTTRLIQLRHADGRRRVALVDDPRLHILASCDSIYDLANHAITKSAKLSELARSRASADDLDYDLIYSGRSDWRILPPIDHPQEPARCTISGTGLTHIGSARDRQAMHAKPESAGEDLTDSMKMFRWGLEGGRPAVGHIGIAPEWFYKGNGAMVRAHSEPLDVPAFALDGGEEAEIAGIYVVDAEGHPRRVGFSGGNEFSDHRFEKTNYLNLAGSKLRTCALGPELVLDSAFDSVQVDIAIERVGGLLWSKTIKTGEAEMCHSLRNIEHHHFKYDLHRRPGDVHVHFFGTDYLSFGDGIQLADGDIVKLTFEGFGRPLSNPLRIAKGEPALIEASPLG